MLHAHVWRRACDGCCSELLLANACSCPFLQEFEYAVVLGTSALGGVLLAVVVDINQAPVTCGWLTSRHTARAYSSPSA